MEPPIDVDSKWINMNKVEHDKLEWMKDLPPPSAGHTEVTRLYMLFFSCPTIVLLMFFSGKA